MHDEPVSTYPAQFTILWSHDYVIHVLCIIMWAVLWSEPTIPCLVDNSSRNSSICSYNDYYN